METNDRIIYTDKAGNEHHGAYLGHVTHVIHSGTSAVTLCSVLFDGDTLPRLAVFDQIREERIAPDLTEEEYLAKQDALAYQADTAMPNETPRQFPDPNDLAMDSLG